MPQVAGRRVYRRISTELESPGPVSRPENVHFPSTVGEAIAALGVLAAPSEKALPNGYRSMYPIRLSGSVTRKWLAWTSSSSAAVIRIPVLVVGLMDHEVLTVACTSRTVSQLAGHRSPPLERGRQARLDQVITQTSQDRVVYAASISADAIEAGLR